MSALEQTPIQTDRRRAPRLRIKETVPVTIGRGDGVLVDLSERGARVRYTVPARRGAIVLVSFAWHEERFCANAEVLSTRVVALEEDEMRTTIYESRLRFMLMTDSSKEILSRVLASIESRAIQAWIANLYGESDESSRPIGALRQSISRYIRCRLVGRTWDIKRTHDRDQPLDGFIVPDNVEQHDIDRLCATYEQLDADGRQLIRLIAAAVVSP